MATVQIDETELVQYRQLHGAAAAILAHPEARKMLHKAQKLVNPNARIPEVEIEERVEAQANGLNEKLDSVIKSIADDRAERAAAAQAAEIQQGWDRQITDLRRRGFTEDGIAKIQEHALKESIPNLRAAANDYLTLNPPPAPETPSGFGSWDFFGEGPKEDKFVEKMIESRGDNDGVLNKEIADTLTEFRSQNVGQRY